MVSPWGPELRTLSDSSTPPSRPALSHTMGASVQKSGAGVDCAGTHEPESGSLQEE
jgi:hypothetical protein